MFESDILAAMKTKGWDGDEDEKSIQVGSQTSLEARKTSFCSSILLVELNTVTMANKKLLSFVLLFADLS